MEGLKEVSKEQVQMIVLGFLKDFLEAHDLYIVDEEMIGLLERFVWTGHSANEIKKEMNDIIRVFPTLDKEMQEDVINKWKEMLSDTEWEIVRE